MRSPPHTQDHDVLISIPDILTREEVGQLRQRLDGADWQDGRHSAGPQSASVKTNLQLPQDGALARELGQGVLGTLARNATFLSAALPLRILPPTFNSYSGGQTFGVHVDNAIRVMPGSGERIRTDLSATLFLVEPDAYDGGELVVETLHGANEVKLPAGHLVLYPSTSLHCVTPVTRGRRVAAVFWVQSMVRGDEQRTMLFDLDGTIQELQAERGPQDPASIRLTGIYHNLIRQWADT